MLQTPPELRVGARRLVGGLRLTAKPLLPGAKFDGAKAYAKMTSRCLDDSWRSIAFFSGSQPGTGGGELVEFGYAFPFWISVVEKKKKRELELFDALILK